MTVNRLTRGNLQFILGLALGITASFMLTSFIQFAPTSVKHGGYPVRPGVPAELQQLRDLDEHELHEMLAHGEAADGPGAKAVHFEDVHVHHGE